MTSDEVVQANANFIQLISSIEEVRASQATATAKKQQDKAAAQRDKNVTRQQKTAEAKAAATAVLAKHGVDTVDNLQHANLERFTGAELDAVHKFKVGKAAKGNVAAKCAAVATLVDVAPPAVEDGDGEDDDDDDGSAGVSGL